MLSNKRFIAVMDELINKMEPFAVATVVRIEGSSLGKPGFKVIISKEGDILYGSLGGVCPESAIVNTAKKAIETATPRTVRVFLESTEKAVEATILSQSEDEVHVETNCGGMMEIYIEPYLPQPRLILIGQGGKDDVEDSLVKLGKLLDFEVIVIDHNPFLSEEPDQLIDELDFDISNFKFKESDCVVVLTKGERDIEVLSKLSRFRLRFVGLLASRKRVKDNIDSLRKLGIDSRFIESLHAPVGIDIGAITPSEIALSIMADIIATKYGRQLPRKGMEEKASIELKS